MNRTCPHPFAVAVMLVGLSWPEVAMAAQQTPVDAGPSAPPARALTIVVEVENDARIPPAELAGLEDLVGRTYLAIGVRVIWVHGEVPLLDPRGLRIHLRLLSRTRADRKIAIERIGRAVLAQTNRPARIVYAFCNRIVEASVKYSEDYTHILGLVVAHEFGHVLLPTDSHSDTGIMKGDANLWAKPAHDFTPEEGAAIRSTLLRESQTGL